MPEFIVVVVVVMDLGVRRREGKSTEKGGGEFHICKTYVAARADRRYFSSNWRRDVIQIDTATWFRWEAVLCSALFVINSYT